MKYFLVGYMACGKSRLGREMAKDLRMPFIDLDDYIARREGRTITEIFSADGEAAFRTLERRCLEEACASQAGFVMATGGGTPCFFDNMDYMNARGKTIFIDTSPRTIAARLLRGKARRPLVGALADGEILPFVERHLEERRQWYEKAQEVWEEE